MNNCIIIVDEFQNCTFQELDTIITRVGEKSKIVFSGDFTQSDLEKHRDREGMQRFLNILHRMGDFQFVDFGVDDIVRSGLVKSYILAKTSIE